MRIHLCCLSSSHLLIMDSLILLMLLVPWCSPCFKLTFSNTLPHPALLVSSLALSITFFSCSMLCSFLSSNSFYFWAKKASNCSLPAVFRACFSSYSLAYINKDIRFFVWEFRWFFTLLRQFCVWPRSRLQWQKMTQY